MASICPSATMPQFPVTSIGMGALCFFTPKSPEFLAMLDAAIPACSEREGGSDAVPATDTCGRRRPVDRSVQFVPRPGEFGRCVRALAPRATDGSDMSIEGETFP